LHAALGHSAKSYRRRAGLEGGGHDWSGLRLYNANHERMESEGSCKPGECHLGFSWNPDEQVPDVACVMLHQSDVGAHSTRITLQRLEGPLEDGRWIDVITWENVQEGRTRMAVACPAQPSVLHANTGACRTDNDRTKECPLESTKASAPRSHASAVSMGSGTCPNVLKLAP